MKKVDKNILSDPNFGKSLDDIMALKQSYEINKDVKVLTRLLDTTKELPRSFINENIKLMKSIQNLLINSDIDSNNKIMYVYDLFLDGYECIMSTFEKIDPNFTNVDVPDYYDFIKSVMTDYDIEMIGIENHYDIEYQKTMHYLMVEKAKHISYEQYLDDLITARNFFWQYYFDEQLYPVEEILNQEMAKLEKTNPNLAEIKKKNICVDFDD